MSFVSKNTWICQKPLWNDRYMPKYESNKYSPMKLIWNDGKCSALRFHSVNNLIPENVDTFLNYVVISPTIKLMRRKETSSLFYLKYQRYSKKQALLQVKMFPNFNRKTWEIHSVHQEQKRQARNIDNNIESKEENFDDLIEIQND